MWVASDRTPAELSARSSSAARVMRSTRPLSFQRSTRKAKRACSNLFLAFLPTLQAYWGILSYTGYIWAQIQGLSYIFTRSIQVNALQGQHTFFTAPRGYSIMARNMQEHNHQGGHSRYSRKQDLRWLELRGALGVTSLRGSVCTILDTHGQG